MAIGIVMLGDVVGAPGRFALAQQLPAIRERFAVDLVIANAENAAAGSGLTPELYRKLCEAGVDGLTLGDHAYRKKQIVPTLEQQPNIIVPANLPAAAAGKRWMRLTAADGTRAVYVVTLLGRLFMGLPVNHPFAVIDQVLASLPQRDPIVIVEVHAEATSEKQALGWYLNGRVAAVIGTHTHVPTADARILPADLPAGAAGGTAYITDLGMSGPYDSVLGRRVDRVITHMSTAMPAPFDVAEANPRVCGIYLEIDEATGRALRCQPIDMPADARKPPFVVA